MKDDLGNRMKDMERRSKTFLQRRTHTLLRLDGKAFHTFTRGYKKPYDLNLMSFMDAAAVALCEQIEGARFAYVQSDEIQVLVTDFGGRDSEMWFDGEVQKLVSVSASIATAAFNHALSVHEVAEMVTAIRDGGADHRENESASSTPPALVADVARLKAYATRPRAHFDSRVWQIAPRIEVYNAFLWRQKDAIRNAVSMTAQAHFPHRQLHGASTDTMLTMLQEKKDIFFEDMPFGFQRGRFVEKITYTADVTYVDKRTGESKVAVGVTRSQWQVAPPPLFGTPEGRQWLLERIPQPAL